MRSAKMITYLFGCAWVLFVGTALAKEPAPTAATALSTPAGCMDSARGRTHILRFCGQEHYWIKRPMAAPQWPNGFGMANLGGALGVLGGAGPTVSVNLNR